MRVSVRVRVFVLVVVDSPSATAMRGRRRAVKSAESCIVKMFVDVCGDPSGSGKNRPFVYQCLLVCAVQMYSGRLG